MLKILNGLVLKKDSIYYVKCSGDLFLVLNLVKNSSGIRCESLIDIIGIDLMDNRVEVRYVLRSMLLNKVIIIGVVVEKGVELESVIKLFKSSDWLEREVFDLFGVVFKNRKNLVRILTDYGTKDNVLLKSFSDSSVRCYRVIDKVYK